MASHISAPALFQVTLPAAGLTASTPFIIICGWFRCVDKHLAKYTDVLATLGIGFLDTGCTFYDVDVVLCDQVAAQ